MAPLSTVNCVVYISVVILFVVSSSSADVYPVVFDDSPGMGRVFEGIGAISGGGATSKLLVNYPKEQRDQILDYLFKPGFAASLQIIKVEIGGDVQSTDGTEASHMHNSWEENYKRGYEWWLLQEAKKRNPEIKVYGLPWGFPGWIGQGKGDPYVDVSVTADYIVRWIKGAKRVYNITVDYIGIWNEKSYNVDYIKTLRSMMDSSGFNNVQIIASDGGWGIAKDIQKDAKLANSIHAIGCHYPGTYSSSDAQKTGKTLWSSEDYSTVNDNVGGGCWARILNQNYVNGYMTSTISWNLITSYYAKLPFSRNGLMNALEPWSGNYEVSSPIWISAHTTQFVPIGWTYLKHDSGVAKLRKGGSYVSLTDPEKKHLTIVIETMTHDHSICVRPKLPPYTVEKQDVVITLKGSFSTITQMNVWHSKLGFDGEKTVLFEQKDPIVFKDGQATLSLDLDEVYTLTTMNNGQKGSFSHPPVSKPFPLPYSDDFEAHAEFQEPFNLAPQIGSYETIQRKNSKVMRQTVLEKPVQWCGAESVGKSLNIIGNNNWTDIFIEIDFEISPVNGTDGVFVAARVTNGGCWGVAKGHGIYFFVFEDKFIVANDLARKEVLKTGPVPKSSGWHTISLLVKDGKVTGAFDKEQTFQIDAPSSPAHGWVGIGTDSFGLADFDNLKITNSSDGDTIMRSYSRIEHPKFIYIQ